MVCGIGTDVGKTIASAILVEALGAGYWKPLQAGMLEETDTHVIERLVPSAACYPESFRFVHPLSPHHAAYLEGLDVNDEHINIPKHDGDLIIESSGGVLVPYQKDRLLIDLFCKWNCEWVIVSRHYLGSINHTLLTVDVLQRRRVRLLGIIFNGNPEPFSEEAIISISGLPMIGRIYQEAQWTPSLIRRYAWEWKHSVWSKEIGNVSGILLHK